MSRTPGRAVVVVAMVILGSALQGAPVVVADSNNPCDVAPALPYCDSALGPLRDVTTTWRNYQPALLQPIPISDYCATEPTCAGGDPEDQAEPLGAGWCATETVHQAASGPQVPASTESATLPGGIPAPPGKNHPYAGSRYCLLRYLAADFTPLCSGCHRILIDFAAIPSGTYNSTAPAADGHWAARFTTDSNFNAITPINGHSPNIKNLCADKFFNDATGADCVKFKQFDEGAHEFEGDATIFHHYPLEGRYFNGPSYLAGDGVTVPLHWVNAAYFDVDPAGAASMPTWYNAGYRGKGDAVPDTDQSYGCPCEAPGGIVPGVAGSGHTTWSPSLVILSAVAPRPAPSPSTHPATVTNSSNPGSGLPATSRLAPLDTRDVGLMLALLGVFTWLARAAVARLRR
jgi:hypothetical protein